MKLNTTMEVKLEGFTYFLIIVCISYMCHHNLRKDSFTYLDFREGIYI